MKISMYKDSENCATVEVEKGHTHTMFHADTEKNKDASFNEVHITYSDFPEGHQGIHIDTFDNGDIYIGIPRHLNIQIRLSGL